jgi:hypothetical protein
MTYLFPDKPKLATPAILATLKDGEWIAQEKDNGWRCRVRYERRSRNAEGHPTEPDVVQFTSANGGDLAVSPQFAEQVAGWLARAQCDAVTYDAEYTGRSGGCPRPWSCSTFWRLMTPSQPASPARTGSPP